jgi:glutathione-regulated potassium-efflux system ancillary protein KefG
MAPRVNSEDLVDSQIVADILGLSQRNTVTTYLKRYPDMPRPVVELGAGRVRLWLRGEIEAWARVTGRHPRPDPGARRGQRHRT